MKDQRTASRQLPTSRGSGSQTALPSWIIKQGRMGRVKANPRTSRTQMVRVGGGEACRK
ncbi:hypothetical protein BD309DRAFT_973279 [Dichomitus squalens]|nr:hypothetical protein BD309DRAFT_973279 [Dichomitus squalens]